MKFTELEKFFVLSGGQYSFGKRLVSLKSNDQYPFIITPYKDNDINRILFNCIPIENPVNYSSFCASVVDNFTLGHYSNDGDVNYAYLRILGVELTTNIQYYFNTEALFDCKSIMIDETIPIGNSGENIVVNGAIDPNNRINIVRVTRADILNIKMFDIYGNNFELKPARDELTGECGLFDTYTQMLYTNSNINGGRFGIEF